MILTVFASVILAADVSCGVDRWGNSLRIADLNDEDMDIDQKVWGIDRGSWAEGCYSCGKYLQDHGKLCPGWYCEEGTVWGVPMGIWLKRSGQCGSCEQPQTPYTPHGYYEWYNSVAAASGNVLNMCVNCVQMHGLRDTSGKLHLMCKKDENEMGKCARC